MLQPAMLTCEIDILLFSPFTKADKEEILHSDVDRALTSFITEQEILFHQSYPGCISSLAATQARYIAIAIQICLDAVARKIWW